MNPENALVETSGTPSSRIWYQSFVDPQEHLPSIQRLQERLTAHAGLGVRFLEKTLSRCLQAPTDLAIHSVELIQLVIARKGKHRK